MLQAQRASVSSSLRRLIRSGALFWVLVAAGAAGLGLGGCGEPAEPVEAAADWIPAVEVRSEHLGVTLQHLEHCVDVCVPAGVAVVKGALPSALAHTGGWDGVHLYGSWQANVFVHRTAGRTFLPNTGVPNADVPNTHVPVDPPVLMCQVLQLSDAKKWQANLELEVDEIHSEGGLRWFEQPKTRTRVYFSVEKEFVIFASRPEGVALERALYQTEEAARPEPYRDDVEITYPDLRMWCEPAAFLRLKDIVSHEQLVAAVPALWQELVASLDSAQPTSQGKPNRVLMEGVARRVGEDCVARLDEVASAGIAINFSAEDVRVRCVLTAVPGSALAQQLVAGPAVTFPGVVKAGEALPFMAVYLQDHPVLQALGTYYQQLQQWQQLTHADVKAVTLPPQDVEVFLHLLAGRAMNLFLLNAATTPVLLFELQGQQNGSPRDAWLAMEKTYFDAAHGDFKNPIVAEPAHEEDGWTMENWQLPVNGITPDKGTAWPTLAAPVRYRADCVWVAESSDTKQAEAFCKLAAAGFSVEPKDAEYSKVVQQMLQIDHGFLIALVDLRDFLQARVLASTIEPMQKHAFLSSLSVAKPFVEILGIGAGRCSLDLSLDCMSIRLAVSAAAQGVDMGAAPAGAKPETQPQR